MNCPHCNTENQEDAVYCMRCGRRLDGTAECPNCKKTIPAEATFCPYCGKNIEELAASDGSLTAVVGSQTSDGSPAARAEKESTAAAEKQALNEKARRILTLCAAACSLAMAVTALVFVFFTGVSAVSGFTRLDCDLFYYFGTAYEEIAALDTAGMTYELPYIASLYIQTVPLTLLSAVSLAGVAVLAVAGIVYDILFFAGKSARRRKFSQYAFLAYLVFSVLFLALNGIDVQSAMQITLNAATKAGVALGTIFFAGRFGCLAAADARRIFLKDLPNTLFSLGKAVLSAVLLGVSSLPLFGLFAADGSGMTLSPFALLALLGNQTMSEIGVTATAFIEVFTLLTCFALCAVALLAAVNLHTGTDATLSPGSAKHPLRKSAALAACSAALLVFSIVSAALLTDAGVLAEVSVGYAVPAVLFVFSLLLPAADLVQAHLFRNGRNGQKAPFENADGQN